MSISLRDAILFACLNVTRARFRQSKATVPILLDLSAFRRAGFLQNEDSRTLAAEPAVTVGECRSVLIGIHVR